MTGLENEFPHKLSGGQQQRVAFARVLMSDAEFLLLDEPFSALDSYLKWRLEIKLAEVLKSYNGAAILVSHDISEVYRMAKKIAVLNFGKIDTINTTHELFDKPKTLAAALMTGCKNISRAKKIDANKLFAENWRLTLHSTAEVPDGLSYVAIHAQFVNTDSAQCSNSFEAEVVQVIEDTNFFSVMVAPKDSEGLPIRWDVDKKIWRKIQADTFKLKLPADKLILLEG